MKDQVCFDCGVKYLTEQMKMTREEIDKKAIERFPPRPYAATKNGQPVINDLAQRERQAYIEGALMVVESQSAIVKEDDIDFSEEDETTCNLLCSCGEELSNDGDTICLDCSNGMTFLE
jgi:hypothetical protein